MEKVEKRHCIKMNRIHGEAASTDIESLQIAKAAIKEKVEGYSACDIYNFDETALFYAALPRTRISHQKFSGWNENKKLLIVGLLYNADGIDKWSDILMIGHARRLNCSNKNSKKQEAVDHGFFMYHYNSKAWMTRSIFYVFLHHFDRSMKVQNRKVLLILNSFSDHIYHKYNNVPTNVELLFLPRNTTSHLQPLNGSIIWASKTYFKCKQYAKTYQYIGMIQNGKQDKIGAIDKIFEIDQLWAIKWIR
ncbi:hypothetical protein PHYBLDRAFT_108315 [Phycomyces blakesleeanus NRRL 1555(-)]|uniref:DDE-1 domain-containing protein n=1 Tax=Phycomyces blakesleeanus (strain ATCC 8743b / DSM 1359 / FGSC 10004 / NBRC 33097 / NRRL 1555) TaxID=763407 RepID=A0A162URT1_PHYB8|nr:hypothetical protein PHYBLDRAFT_108315 [Phycomyces blakesleeanus NRRL 1555(-)]OAD77403.1 hypothetical protein PHYBLDRAFT_108315 [Phycomyces blakesleeanus NRRL 1555(-)]|eukprot:XP_018295443.1 hypothetical protein PHYBLDRAFT_108315 [Phycomyces blakesleeanus NRRL 1555(-)]